MFIIGAGGHSRSVIALLKDCGLHIKGIYDNSWVESSKEEIFGIPLLGKINDALVLDPVCLSTGDNSIRKELFEKLYKKIYKPLIKHSTSFIDVNVEIGEANLVFGKAFINAGAIIGFNNIINTSAVIEHECNVGNHCHISVGAILCGRVKIGNNCFIGAGSVIKDKVNICDNVTIGAGSVVVKNIIEPGVYVSNPARKIK